ncbi:hypothetical protein [Jeotgalibaca arthritidis]|uniref:Uncharacterized protein n=1 Tax=Jeotgalibaca arthritidis TaxID=1868794 RepID=A0A6G7K6Z6_9LACT|nr:hypothetical protein [Jeotgalibaca arthritidis]QII81034.1 hypothetical protein G7057_00140 [Jeotgalibaca arthritidis]
MHSELLAKHGLTHFITGSDYNFRYQTVGGNIKKELERALAHHHLSINQLYMNTYYNMKGVGANGGFDLTICYAHPS